MIFSFLINFFVEVVFWNVLLILFDRWILIIVLKFCFFSCLNKWMKFFGVGWEEVGKFLVFFIFL